MLRFTRSISVVMAIAVAMMATLAQADISPPPDADFDAVVAYQAGAPPGGDEWLSNLSNTTTDLASFAASTPATLHRDYLQQRLAMDYFTDKPILEVNDSAVVGDRIDGGTSAITLGTHETDPTTPPDHEIGGSAVIAKPTDPTGGALASASSTPAEGWEDV